MAKVIADALGGDLDVVLVHKLSHREERELAIGAIDDSGNAILTDYAAQVDPEYLESEKHRQLEALRQCRARYTPLRPPVDPQGRIVIVVADCVATDSRMGCGAAGNPCQEAEGAHCGHGSGFAGSRAGDRPRM